MELTQEQKQTVVGWVKEGCGLSQVQKRLHDELGISMTYMDVRFLVLDLKVQVKDREVARPKAAPAVDAEPVAGDDDETAPFPGEPTAGLEGVRVGVDTIMKPGSLVSGTVAFSDGKAGTWMLDQYGRLALDVGDPAYRPSPEDLQSFQAQLQQTLMKRGY